MNEKKVLALYIRISNEDKDITKSGKEESNSVTNQRNLLNNYISENDDLKCYEVKEFFDDGYSGTNFDRPAVTKLLNDAKSGKIQAILVKDFSRFARSYLEVGDYLEQIFPFLGIRFISVNDGFDSSNSNGITAGMDIALKNFVYEMYSKDLSVKIKTAKLTKMKKGEFISSYAPFGYEKSKEKKNTIIVDVSVKSCPLLFFLLFYKKSLHFPAKHVII